MGIKQIATLETEREFFSAGVQLIAGMDEVGRGSLAGPVGVGAALLPVHSTLTVAGLTDSKALSEKKRTAMVPLINRWCTTGVGYSSPLEIDVLGMTRALRLAGQRALSQAMAISQVSPDLLLLDGQHDWLSAAPDNFLHGGDEAQTLYRRLLAETWRDSDIDSWQGSVKTVIKGDSRCASIAAASVVAKVDRDRVMGALDRLYPAYGWAKNKGYGSLAHRRALEEEGPSIEHRLSWNLKVSTESLRRAYRERVHRAVGE